MPSERAEETGSVAGDSQSDDEHKSAAQSKRWRMRALVGTMVSPFIVGLVLLMFGKGYDYFLGQGVPSQAPPVLPSVSPTSWILSTLPSMSPSVANPTVTVPPAPATPKSNRPPVGRTTTSQPQPAPGGPAVLASGHETIVNVDGFDLDTGSKGYQDDPGMDISPDRLVTQIHAMSHGKPRMAVLRQPGAPSYASCKDLAPSAYVQVLRDIRTLRVGDHICVLTNQSNYGAITLTEIPSDTAQYLTFDFIAWDTP
jgi:hypothetical protein